MMGFTYICTGGCGGVSETPGVCQATDCPKHGKPLTKLTEEQFRVMRQRGTETPFTGTYVNEHGKGMYTCAACGAHLFSSEAKFDSGTGWPSFTSPANRENIELRPDHSHGMSRTEVVCKKCGSHLGHVFDDGPKETGGKRYCINSVCLGLEKK